MRRALGRLGRSPRAWAALAYLASRLFYRVHMGVELDTSPVYYFLQFLDPYYLENDLGRSLLALHHQAPLLNLLVGLSMKLFGRFAFAFIDLVFVALGLAATVSVASVCRRLGVGRVASALAAAAWAASPVTVMYEAWLFYPHVVASAFLVSAALLLTFLRRETVGSGAMFFGSLAVIGLVRSTYGPLWFICVLGLSLWLAPVRRRTLLKAAAGPLLVLLIHSAKTPLYVGHGYGDAMLWPNLAKKVHMHLPRSEQRKLKRKGVLSPAMRYEAFSDLSSMADARVPHPPTGVPALDDTHAPSGRANANAIEHVLIAERHYKRDATLLLARYPRTYVDASLDALLVQYPRSPTTDITLVRSPNYTRLEPADSAYKKALLVGDRQFSPVLACLLSFGLAAGALFAIGPRSRLGSSRSRRAFAFFATFSITYTTAVTVLVSWGDFSRYRYEVDGLYWVLIVAGGAALTRAVGSWYRALASKWTTRSTGCTSPRSPTTGST